MTTNNTYSPVRHARNYSSSVVFAQGHTVCVPFSEMRDSDPKRQVPKKCLNTPDLIYCNNLMEHVNRPCPFLEKRQKEKRLIHYFV